MHPMILTHKDVAVNLNGAPRKILVVFFSGLGNALLFRPTLKIIKKELPNARLDFLIKQDIVETLLKPDTPDSTFFRWPGGGMKCHGMLSKIRDERYDCLLTTFEEQGWKLALFGELSGIPMRIGYRRGKWYDSLYTQVLTFDPALHEVDRHLTLLNPLQLQQLPAQDLSLSIGADFPHLLPFLPQDKISVCIHAGCSRRLRQKRWPLEKFITVGRELNRKLDANIIFLGGLDERDMIPEIERSLGNKARVLIGKLNIWETAFIIKNSALMISNDSGLMHLACSVSTPVVAIFGPSDPVKNRPFSVRSRVVASTALCRPCNIVHVKCSRQCLLDISTEKVLNVALEMLPGKMDASSRSLV